VSSLVLVAMGETISAGKSVVIESGEGVMVVSSGVCSGDVFRL
jgi:hypothetical protein